MKVKFPMREIADNAAVMDAIAALATQTNAALVEASPSMAGEKYSGAWDNRYYYTENGKGIAAAKVLCSVQCFYDGDLNPEVPYTKTFCNETQETDHVSYRNPDQTARIDRHYVYLEGQRNALWGDELEDLMEAIKDSGIAPVCYETSDERLEWHETLASYKIKYGRKPKYEHLYAVEETLAPRPRTEKPRHAA